MEFYPEHCRGLYFTLFQEKPPEKKLLLLADFIKKLGPFHKKNSILTIFTDPKAKRSENAPKKQMQSHTDIDNLMTNLKIHIREKSNKCNQCDYALVVNTFKRSM